MKERQADTGPSDEALMQLYAQGDQEAFRTLYLRHRGRLHRFIRRIARDKSVADEVFQETWIAIIDGRSRYVATARFVTFLFSIAQKRLAHHRRQGRTQGSNTEASADLGESTALAQSSDEPDRSAENESLGRALLHAVEQLPIEQREAFLLKAEGDLTVTEIAEVTGVGSETAKSRLRYAFNRLRHELRTWR
ncbi:RNA polymerase sigma-70 factor (ECF subfamily) [Povalibacter uvarum]|uniref:RNA polymerase sigma-70 factor (ECF subfamily) n=1 Tax=Povalibacter uvarum TaxID=732238 RepID=A0A841HMK0_9GAMM|nr:sigma-70 family RNA polymerase sigma factor [Povalibacter uvarum]MBB6093973.1 RNA polymerase sigma-70 factor (ECF subfamily) [Povalibacter uvarum]